MNKKVFYFFYNLTHQSEGLDRLIIFVADTFPYVVIFLACLFLFFQKNLFGYPMSKLREMFVIFFSTLFAWLMAYILKFLFHTTRPFELFQNVTPLFPETGYAFPSAHATFFMALAISLFFYHKKVGYVFGIFAILIGLARIIAGVHHPVDILGGFLLGALTAWGIRYLYDYFKEK